MKWRLSTKFVPIWKTNKGEGYNGKIMGKFQKTP